MKKRLITVISAMILWNSLLIGGGTYAFFTAQTDTLSETFQTGAIDIQSSATGSPQTAFCSFALKSNCSGIPVQYPMFYDHADYPTGPNPYDRTISSPSGEIPGGWAPGDQVERTWTISNRRDASKITQIYADKFLLFDKKGNSVARGTQAYHDFLKYMHIAVYYPDDSSTPVYSDTFEKLVSEPQLLDTVICLRKCSASQIVFVASMDVKAGNDLQGLKGVLDFQLGAEQTEHNCFDPPFSHWKYSMQKGSITPIKFECYDFEGNFIKYSQNVKLVISGRGFSHTYTLRDDLSCNGGHYQANVDGSSFRDGVTYTATVYVGSKAYGSKTFTTEPGNRSNA